MILHEARIADTEIGRRGTYAASGLLHNDGEDETMVHLSLRRNLLDAIVDITDFVPGVISPGVEFAESAFLLSTATLFVGDI